MMFHLLVCVCILFLTTRVESTIYNKKVGDGVALIPPTVPGLTRILWKHGNNRAAEFDPDFKPPLDVYGVFKGRTTLDIKTGQLVISGLLASDSGLYTVELNGKLQPTTFDLKVIEGVRKPKINESCNDTKTSCSLTCDGDTTGSEPVSYIWRRGEETLSVTDKTLTITQTDDQIETYTCQMKNPVSQEDSDPFKNPFYISDGGLAAGLGSFGVLVAAFLGFIGIHKHKAGVWFFQKEPRNPFNKDFWTKQGDSAGRAEGGKKNTDEENDPGKPGEASYNPVPQDSPVELKNGVIST